MTTRRVRAALRPSPSPGRLVVELHRPLRAAARGWHVLWERPAPGGPRVRVGRMWNTPVGSLWIRRAG